MKLPKIPKLPTEEQVDEANGKAFPWIVVLIIIGLMAQDAFAGNNADLTGGGAGLWVLGILIGGLFAGTKKNK